jgi:predicted metal-dependent peptidase
MAKPVKKTPAELRLERMRNNIEHAKWSLGDSVLGPLLGAVEVVETSDVQWGCVDPQQGVIWVNPCVRPETELTAPQWSFIIGHMLLHLGLKHGPRGVGKDPVVWSLACEYATNNLLKTLAIGEPPPGVTFDGVFAGTPEEYVYEELMLSPDALEQMHTFAGKKRPDMVERKAVYGIEEPKQRRRRDYENLFAEGIRQAVDWAVHQAAATVGVLPPRSKKWHPLEMARRWVINELPLIGALAAQIRLYADAELCDRMHIEVAAVNPFLGEIYFRPNSSLTQEQVLFIYVHELLHIALMHHARLQGRDPLIWNYATDFVINGWLVEMGVGQMPPHGGLYDPRLQGMGAEEVYDMLMGDAKRCKALRGFRGKLGDLILDRAGVFRSDVATLDDMIRRCMACGLACQGMGRGTAPAGLLEEIRSLFAPPVPWDVELARWMDAHVPMVRDPLRTYARASRRQSSTPDIPRPARWVPQEWKDACTFGVVLDTSGSMDREMLGRALGAIASYAEARDVPAVRLMMCDAAPYDRGIVAPDELRGLVAVVGRGGTVLQPAINFLLSRPDFPPTAPIMVITDGWCEEEIVCPRDHCFVLPRKGYSEGNAMPLRTSVPVFRVLKEEQEDF